MSLREDDLDRAARNVRLDEAAIEESYLLASGPGGQNVNKVSTAVRLRFRVAGAQFVGDDETRRRLLALAGSRATAEGDIVLLADRFRSRERNREDALERPAGLPPDLDGCASAERSSHGWYRSILSHGSPTSKRVSIWRPSSPWGRQRSVPSNGLQRTRHRSFM